MRKARALPCSAINTPFLIRALRWRAVPLGLAKPKCEAISRCVGHARPALSSESMNLRTAACFLVNLSTSDQVTTNEELCQLNSDYLELPCEGARSASVPGAAMS